MPKKPDSKASENKGMGKKPESKATGASIHSMPLSELAERVARAEQLAREIDELFPGLAPLTDDERLHTSGRFRDGEEEALRAMLAGARLRPELFASLADKDEGHDPGTFEVELLEDRLARRALLQRLSVALAPVADKASDTMLHLGDQSRPVLLAAYRIAKTVAETDDKLRQKISGALNFYGGIGKSAASTRRKKKDG